MFNGHRLGWCANWGADCGEPAAEAWCIAQGFAGAGEFHESPEDRGQIADPADRYRRRLRCPGLRRLQGDHLPRARHGSAGTGRGYCRSTVAPGRRTSRGPADAATLPTAEPAPLPATPVATAAAADSPVAGAAASPGNDGGDKSRRAGVPNRHGGGDPGRARGRSPCHHPGQRPGQAAASDPPAVVQPISATATMEATDDDPGPPPPETAVLAAAGAPPLRPVLEVFEDADLQRPPARLVPRLEGPLRQGDGGRVLPAQRLRRSLVLRARSEDRRDRTDAADRVRPRLRSRRVRRLRRDRLHEVRAGESAPTPGVAFNLSSRRAARGYRRVDVYARQEGCPRVLLSDDFRRVMLFGTTYEPRLPELSRGEQDFCLREFRPLQSPSIEMGGLRRIAIRLQRDLPVPVGDIHPQPAQPTSSGYGQGHRELSASSGLSAK